MPSPDVNRTMNATEWLLLVVLSVLWSGSFLFVGVAVRELPPLTVVVARVVLAALALQAYVRAAGIALPSDGRTWMAFATMALLNNAIPFTLIGWAQMHIPSGLASILNATAPLFTVVVAHAFTTDERMIWPRLAGTLVGFAGVAAMMGATAQGASNAGIVAQLAVLAAAFSYALAGVYGRRFSRMGVDAVATAAGQVATSSLMLLPLMIVVDRPWTLTPPGAATVLALVGLALLSTALGYVLYFSILATAGATNLLLVTLLIPVSAILLGATLLSERLEPAHLAGMLLIAAGLALIDGRPLAAARRRVSGLPRPLSRSD